MSTQRRGKRDDEAPEADGQVFRTKRQLANHYKTSPTTASNWTGRADFPGGPRGPWRQDQVDEFLAQIRSPFAPDGRAPVESGADDGVTLSRQKLRADVDKAREDVRAKRLRNNLLEGRWLDKDVVVLEVSQLFLRLKERWEAAPAEMCVELPLAQRDAVRARWEEMVALMLREIAGWKMPGDSTG